MKKVYTIVATLIILSCNSQNSTNTDSLSSTDTTLNSLKKNGINGSVKIIEQKTYTTAINISEKWDTLNQPEEILAVYYDVHGYEKYGISKHSESNPSLGDSMVYEYNKGKQAAIRYYSDKALKRTDIYEYITTNNYIVKIYEPLQGAELKLLYADTVETDAKGREIRYRIAATNETISKANDQVILFEYPSNDTTIWHHYNPNKELLSDVYYIVTERDAHDNPIKTISVYKNTKGKTQPQITITSYQYY